MRSTRTAFSLLQAIAVIAALSTILWSVGFASFRFAEAANVTFFSDTLSDSAPSVPANHTLTFNTSNGVAAGGTIVVTFPAASFGGIADIDFGDIDLTVNGAPVSLAATPAVAVWGATTTATSITLTSDTGTIASSATVTIAIGTNTTEGGVGNEQITNPTVNSYEINLTVGTLDTGATRVAIVNAVEVTASVDTILDFEIAGLAAGESINGTSTSGSSTATTIPFGQLRPGIASTTAQQLSVTTNASNGFVVTVQVDGQLVSATGADIDAFPNGVSTSTPTAWIGPTGSLGAENTYGHWGITSNDTSLGVALTDRFDSAGSGNRFVSASSTPVEVFRHNGPSNGSDPHVGQTEVGYQIQITGLQEAGDDYNATLTYVATPVF